jgi:polysaccharide biosynthesis transport protein
LDGADDSDSGSGLLDCWRILRRHKAAILLSALSGLVLGFVIGIPMKPVYRARTSLEVLNLNEDFMNLKQANPVTTNDYSYDTSEEQTQAKLLESNALLDRVYAKLDPGASQNAKKPQMASSGWRSWVHLSQPVPLSRREQLLDKAANTLKVRATPRTRVLDVSVDSTDPKFAADFANTLVQQYVEQNIEARWNSTQRTSDWLSREINDTRSRLQASEDALQEYARSSGLIFTDENTNVATEKLQQLQQELSTATADRIGKQSRFELARNSPPDSLADVLNDAGLRETGAKVNDMRRQIADLSAVYSSEYSKVKRAEAELVTLQDAFERDRADILKRIENDFHEATRKEKLLSSAYDAQTREVTGQGEKAIQYNILKREVDSNRQLYDTMLQQMKQASIASALRASNVRIVDPAELPDHPVSPNFKLNSALGLFAGFFLSIAFVTIRERADRTLQQPGEVKLWTDLPELGTIPNASLEGSKYYARASAAVLNAQPVGRKRSIPARNQPQTVELMTWQERPSLIAEAFRSALTSILFVGENGSRPRVLVFTSANASDGKTTVVSNLAIATAEIRRKVLVIDADLRRPRMHEIFDLQNERGLADLLREEFSEEALKGLIQETRVAGLHVLTGGPPTHAAAHLLYSPNFAALIAKFKKEYDMIFIDTPPMLQMTDARVAGRLADAVVLVARAGQTTRDAMVAAKERFGEDRIRVLGSILNDWDPKRSPGAYYGYSRYDTSRYVSRASEAAAN